LTLLNNSVTLGNTMKEKLINLFKRFFTGNGVVLLILAFMLVIRVADPWPTQVLRLKS